MTLPIWPCIPNVSWVYVPCSVASGPYPHGTAVTN